MCYERSIHFIDSFFLSQTGSDTLDTALSQDLYLLANKLTDGIKGSADLCVTGNISGKDLSVKQTIALSWFLGQFNDVYYCKDDSSSDIIADFTLNNAIPLEDWRSTCTSSALHLANLPETFDSYIVLKADLEQRDFLTENNFAFVIPRGTSAPANLMVEFPDFPAVCSDSVSFPVNMMGKKPPMRVSSPVPAYFDGFGLPFVLPNRIRIVTYDRESESLWTQRDFILRNYCGCLLDNPDDPTPLVRSKKKLLNTISDEDSNPPVIIGYHGSDQSNMSSTPALAVEVTSARQTIDIQK